MTRRSLHDDEWAEKVWERYQRRRDLPFRRLAAAWDDMLDEAVLPLVRWLNRRLGGKP